MRAAIPPRVSVPPGLPPSLTDHSKTIQSIRRLIWIYLILLIIEGALRKWILPQLSNPLLIIRDPVAILIYILALRARCFPWNRYIFSVGVIAMLSWLAGILVLLPYLPPKTVLLVTGYGVRSNFLHLPLIFIIPAVFDIEDVKRVGWWTILGLIPMAALMVAQFHAPPDSFINRAAGLGEGQQIQTAGGKIRPPGTFSFISGAIFYLSTGTAFLLHAALSKLQYRNWLLLAGGLSLIVGVGISGSRGAVLAVGLVIASLGVILLVRPDAMTKLGRNLLLAAILLWAVSYVPIFREGIGVLSERFTESDETVGATVVGGLAIRISSGFTEGLMLLSEAPIGGWGLGIGTNGGAKFVTGESTFLLAEGEWARIILESGPILGLAFLLWRTILTVKLGLASFHQLKRGNILPIMLFCAGAILLVNAPFGQPTNVGFVIALSGLCLAATKTRDCDVTSPQSKVPAVVPHRARRRSVYATRLHGPAADLTNGSADR
jgi:hypothetical protein